MLCRQMKTIVIGSDFVAGYPEGGGIWWVPLQYILGLKKLNTNVIWLELLCGRSEDIARDLDNIRIFQRRISYFGLSDNYVLLYVLADSNYQKIRFYGKQKDDFEILCKDTDVLLNLCYRIKPPLLNKFDRKFLVDLDPGLFQVSALYPDIDMGIGLHDKYFTIGENIGRPYCRIPTLGVDWITFRQPMNLDIWSPQINPDCKRFTTITQWDWQSIRYEDRLIDNSKRTQFMKYIELPNLTNVNQEFEIAANINGLKPNDISLQNDMNLLEKNGWHLVDPHKVAGDPLSYQKYIAQSRAEFSVAKEIYVELKSGWFSDRSICYLASGKPVLVQDTAIEKNLPVGEGLLTFKDMNDIIEGIKNINSNYVLHCKMARNIAEEYFDSNKILKEILKEL